MKAISTKEVKFKDPSRPIIPAGTECTIAFNNTAIATVIPMTGVPSFTTKCVNLPVYFAKDFEHPGMEQLSEWVNDGVCETVTGERTEPDGYGPDGSPSWLVALGLI